MEIQLDPTRIAAGTAAATERGETSAAQTSAPAPLLGGENVKVTSAASTDLEKLVARLKNENETARQSVSQRRAAILATVLDAMADRISETEKETLLEIETLNCEKADATLRLSELKLSKGAIETLIESLDRQIEQAVKDGADHREKVAELKRLRAEEAEKLEAVERSIESVASRIAGIDDRIEVCSKAVASATLNEVYAALRAAAGEDAPEAEAVESQADRDRAKAKSEATDVALHISAALDRIDGQIRAALDAAQMKVEG